MSAGKGDKPRPVDNELYRSNYDKIFRKPKQQTFDISKIEAEDPCGFKRVGETEDLIISKNDRGDTIVVNKKDLIK